MDGRNGTSMRRTQSQMQKIWWQRIHKDKSTFIFAGQTGAAFGQF